MFLPPEQRHPGSSPWDPPPSASPRSTRGETVGLWLIDFLLASLVLAPMGGSSLIEALRAVLH